MNAPAVGVAASAASGRAPLVLGDIAERYLFLSCSLYADAESAEVLVTAGRAQWLPALGWMAAFFLMLWLLGALITVPLFTLVYLLLASRESPLLAGVCALASWVFIYGLFDRLLRIPLP